MISRIGPSLRTGADAADRPSHLPDILEHGYVAAESPMSWAASSISWSSLGGPPRYDKLGANFFVFVKLAAVRIWLRSIEPTA